MLLELVVRSKCLGSHVAHELTRAVIFYYALHIINNILVALGTSNSMRQKIALSNDMATHDVQPR